VAHKTLTFGVLPEFAEFDAAFDRECPSGFFSFGNDKRFGTDEIRSDVLYEELQAAIGEFETGEHRPECPGAGECDGRCECDEAGQWASCVLGVLGFEWI